jgi:hypothetical protein
MNEISASNQRSVGKRVRKTSSFKMPKIKSTGKRAKVTKGPAKKIGKEL